MNVCPSCRKAGDLLTQWKEENKSNVCPDEPWTEVDDSILTIRMGQLTDLHGECPGKDFCFCQHRIE